MAKVCLLSLLSDVFTYKEAYDFRGNFSNLNFNGHNGKKTFVLDAFWEGPLYKSLEELYIKIALLLYVSF